MSAATWIDLPFVATHRHHTGGDIQVLGIASPLENPRYRQVIMWNSNKELYTVPLVEFVRDLPHGQRRFIPLRDSFDLLQFIQVPPIKGDIKKVF